MNQEIINYINASTNVEKLEEKSTKQVAEIFGISTKQAFKELSEISNRGLITKLDPVNGDNLSCCGWIRNNDN